MTVRYSIGFGWYDTFEEAVSAKISMAIPSLWEIVKQYVDADGLERCHPCRERVA